MANNRIDELLTGKNKRDFAREHGIPEQTLYKICKKPTMKNISVDVFLKIAHGLGMTAEELYYGVEPEEPAREYDDPRQADVNEAWESMNEDGRDFLWKGAVAARRTYDKSDGNTDVQGKEVAG